MANETERFFRAVDRAVLEHHSRPSGMPLLLASLPEHRHLFRAVSRNPFLIAEAIDVYPDVLTLDALRDRAWQLIQPYYLKRLDGLIESFKAARSNSLGADDLAETAKAAWDGRIATLLIEAERHIAGAFDPMTGAIKFQNLNHPEIDDLLDDIGEQALKTGSDVVVVPAERMPAKTGIAAVYRF